MFSFLIHLRAPLLLPLPFHYLLRCFLPRPPPWQQSLDVLGVVFLSTCRHPFPLPDVNIAVAPHPSVYTNNNERSLTSVPKAIE